MRPLFSRRVPPPRATLYSKEDCPLCEDAERSVRAAFGSARVDVVDISGDRRLEDEFIFRIPVLLVEGRVFAEGQITMADAKAARQAARNSPKFGEVR